MSSGPVDVHRAGGARERRKCAGDLVAGGGDGHQVGARDEDGGHEGAGGGDEAEAQNGVLVLLVDESIGGDPDAPEDGDRGDRPSEVLALLVVALALDDQGAEAQEQKKKHGVVRQEVDERVASEDVAAPIDHLQAQRRLDPEDEQTQEGLHRTCYMRHETDFFRGGRQEDATA